MYLLPPIITPLTAAAELTISLLGRLLQTKLRLNVVVHTGTLSLSVVSGLTHGSSSVWRAVGEQLHTQQKTLKGQNEPR